MKFQLISAMIANVLIGIAIYYRTGYEFNSYVFGLLCFGTGVFFDVVSLGMLIKGRVKRRYNSRAHMFSLTAYILAGASLAPHFFWPEEDTPRNIVIHGLVEFNIVFVAEIIFSLIGEKILRKYG